MQHIDEFVSGWQCLQTARRKLHEPTFENIVFRLVECYHKLPRNAKSKDYQTTLEYFFVQYYNEFMFKCQVRSPECVAFIDTLKEFGSKTRVQKNDYIQLFQVLCSYYKGSVGGTKNGIPLLCLPEQSLRDSPSYYVDWHYDDVCAILVRMSLDPAQCVRCKGRSKTLNRLVGSRFCPAGCLPLCDRCESNPEMAADFLQRSEAFMIPESSVAMRGYLSNVFDVCSALATDPVSALRDLQISLENHGKKIVVENKRLLSENDSLERKLFDLKTAQIHIVDDNEELQGSLLTINEDRRVMGQRFRQCEDAFYNLRSNNEAVLRELSVTQKQLQDSIREQWRYYECLKRHGLVS